MLKKANDLLYAERTQQAIELYQQFLSTHPNQQNTLAAYYNLAQAFHQNRQFQQSAQCYQKIIEINPNYQQGQMHYQHGQHLQDAKMYKQAKTAYLNYLTLHPTHPGCNFNLGTVLEILKQFDEAFRCYEKAFTAKPDYIKAYKAAIAILKKQNRFDEILNLCRKALKVQPTDVQLIYQQGLSLLRLSKYFDSLSSLKEAISINPKFVRGYIALAEVCFKMDNNEGLAILQKCQRDNKDFMKSNERKEIKLWTGIFKMKMKQFREAAQCFKALADQRPPIEAARSRLAECFEEEGNAYFSKKNFSDAIKCYNDGLKYSPNRTTLLNNAGLAYQNINNIETAERLYRQVLQIQPNNTSAQMNLAALEHIRGNTKKAESMFKKITQENPENYEALINNGKILISQQRYEQAIIQFKNAEKIQKKDNFYLYNDMAVALEKLERYEEALHYADLADRATQHRSPLVLLNRASILMNLKKLSDAKKDLDRANQEIRSPDRSYLVKLGINAQNIKFILNQLDHYSYLMSPIQVFREGLARQIQKCSEMKTTIDVSRVQQKVERAQIFAINQVISEIKKQNTIESEINREKAGMDRATVEKMIKQATAELGELRIKVREQQMTINSLQREMFLVKKESQEFKEKMLKYMPKSYNLREKLEQLYDQKDTVIWQYGKQLYWILNGYLSGYMLVHSGVVGKGDSIDRSTFGNALTKVSGIMQFAQNIPVIGQFAQLVSNVCGLLVDLEDSAIIKKVYEIISFNYDTQQDLNDAVCAVVMLYLTDPVKMNKVRNKIIFDPPAQGFFERIQQKLEDVSQWFSQKKDEFVMHMRGFEKAENIIQSQLAVIDVGIIISIMLNMESNSKIKLPALQNAAKKALADCQFQEMVCSAYRRQNEDLRVSNNSFCSVMRCELIYFNPLLNNSGFADYLRTTGSFKSNFKNILSFSLSEETSWVYELLTKGDYGQILRRLK